MIGDTGWQTRRLRQASGDFVNGFSDWGLYGTLTFRDYLSPTKAQHALQRWARSLARNHLKAHFALAYTMERTAVGVWHFHVLCGPPVSAAPSGLPLSPDYAGCMWRGACADAGFTRIGRFQKHGAAAYYLVKTEGWDIGTVCPRPAKCKRIICPFGPAPW